MVPPSYNASLPGVERLRTLRGLGSRIEPIAWSPDGRCLAAGCSDCTVLVWSVEHEASPILLNSSGGPVKSITWSPDGQRLAATGGCSIRVWRSTGDSFSTKIDLKFEGKASGLGWSPDGEILHSALISGKGKEEELSLVSWEVAGGRIIRSWNDVEWTLCQPAVSNDRRWLALSLVSDVVEIWSMEKGAKIASLSAPYEALFSVAVSPDLQRAILSYADGSIRIWDLVHCRSLGEVQIHDQAAYSLSFSPDSRILASKSRDGKLQFRRCDTWDSLGQLEEPTVFDSEPELAFVPRSYTPAKLATFDEKNTVIRLWTLDIPTLILNGGGTLISILFLSAEPTELQHLRIGEEVRKIQEELKLSKGRDQFYLEAHFAVRSEDLTRSLLELRPQIVTFSGHGSHAGEIILENEAGEAHPVSPEALASIFKVVRRNVQCVILNACYSKQQAEALSRVIPYVIGMSGAIADKAAVSFSIGFYQAIATGWSIPDAYESACAQVRIKGIDGNFKSDLLIGDQADQTA